MLCLVKKKDERSLKCFLCREPVESRMTIQVGYSNNDLQAYSDLMKKVRAAYKNVLEKSDARFLRYFDESLAHKKSVHAVRKSKRKAEQRIDHEELMAAAGQEEDSESSFDGDTSPTFNVGQGEEVQSEDDK